MLMNIIEIKTRVCHVNNNFSNRDLKDEESHLKACCVKYPIKKKQQQQHHPLARFSASGILTFRNRSNPRKIYKTKKNIKSNKMKI